MRVRPRWSSGKIENGVDDYLINDILFWKINIYTQLFHKEYKK
jgi:hypothetical protein